MSDLNERERMLLALAFTYGQGERVGDWYLEEGISGWPPARRFLVGQQEAEAP